MNGIVVAPGAAAGVCLVKMVQDWIVDHACHDLSLAGYGGTDGEMRAVLQKGDGAVNGINDEGQLSLQPCLVVYTLSESQP